METKSKSADVLNRLIQIHNDRMEGYDRASKETDESDLKNLFAQHASTSKQFKDELTTQVINGGGDPKKDTTVPGKVYQAWMDVRAALSTNDRKTVLKSCEFGEDVAVKAYENVLKDDVNDITSEQQQIVRRQYSTVKAQHDKIRNLRDVVIANS
jgi:uncharacterized protein (TIGR02284 family)